MRIDIMASCGILPNAVWNTYVGMIQNIGICFCCNSELISRGNFECGHVQSRAENGDTTVQNMRPICSLCNKSMGTKNMEDFMNMYGFIKNKNWNNTIDANDYILQLSNTGHDVLEKHKNIPIKKKETCVSQRDVNKKRDMDKQNTHKKPKYVCRKCNKPFASRQNLEYHIENNACKEIWITVQAIYRD